MEVRETIYFLEFIMRKKMVVALLPSYMADYSLKTTLKEHQWFVLEWEEPPGHQANIKSFLSFQKWYFFFITPYLTLSRQTFWLSLF